MTDEIRKLLIEKYGYKQYKFADDLYKIFFNSVIRNHQKITIPTLLIVNWVLTQSQKCPVCTTTFQPYSGKTMPTISLTEHSDVITNLAQLQLICRSCYLGKSEIIQFEKLDNEVQK